MSTTAIKREIAEIEPRWKSLREDEAFEGHGGSPGEALVERLDELDAELARRKSAKPGAPS